jgi:hypothetical protein
MSAGKDDERKGRTFGRVFDDEAAKLIELGGTAVHYTLLGGLRAAAFGGDATSRSIAQVVNELPIGRTAAWAAYDDFLRCGVIVGPDGKKYGARGEKVIQPVTEWHGPLTAIRSVKGKGPSATRTVTVRQTVGEIRQTDGDRPPPVLKRAYIDKREERQDVPTPPFLEERLGEVVVILEKSKHAKAFEGKRDGLAVVLSRHPDKDAVQTAQALAERMKDKIGNGPAFFETWLANADELEPPEPTFQCKSCDMHWLNADRCKRLGFGSEPGDECEGR